MIGLEYICFEYKVEYKKLAQLMDVKQQQINSWIKQERKIPKNRLDQLEEIFPKIHREYFQKELTISEKLIVQYLYISDSVSKNEFVEEMNWAILAIMNS